MANAATRRRMVLSWCVERLLSTLTVHRRSIGSHKSCDVATARGAPVSIVTERLRTMSYVAGAPNGRCLVVTTGGTHASSGRSRHRVHRESRRLRHVH